jgi:hypothetical protein
MVAIPDRMVPIVNLLNVRSENALGVGGRDGGDFVVDVATASGDEVGVVEDSLSSDDGNKARVPRTEYAVENKVK